MSNIFAFLRGILDYLGGKPASFYLILVVCVGLDYISGVLSAIVHKRLSSKIGAKGICRKLLIFIIVGLSHMIDTLIIGNGSTLQAAIMLFYIANESVSILENAESIGLPIPRILEDTIQNLKDDMNHNDE